MDAQSTNKRITALEIIFISSVFFYAIWSLFGIIQTTAPDYSVLYHSGKNLILGTNLYKDSTLYTGLGYPPVSLLPFVPFTLLPYQVSQAVWIVGSFLAFLTSLFFILHAIKQFSFRTWAIVASIVFLSFPTKFTFGMGQANFYALALLLLGVSQFPLPRFVRALIFFIAFLLKPHVLLVYGGLLCTKHKASLVWSVGIVVLTTIVLWLVTGRINEVTYIQEMVPSLLRFDGRDIYYNQGIQAFVARLVGNSGSLTAQVISGIVFIVSYVKIYSTKKKNAFEILTVLLPMLLLVEPLSWQHHLIFLLPSVASLWYVFLEHRLHTKTALLMIAIGLVSSNIKNPVYLSESYLAAPLILSHGFYGTCIVWLLSLLYL